MEESTRHTYEGYISRTIAPALGETAVNKISARTLESFYTELRRCRARCSGKPYFEKHKKHEKHDCAAENCKPHECKPMGTSTVRQIHAILSGTLDVAISLGLDQLKSSSCGAETQAETTGTRPAHIGRSRAALRRSLPHG